MRTEVECAGFSIEKEQPGRQNQDSYDFEPQSGFSSDWTDFAAVVADGVGSSAGPSAAAITTARSWMMHTRAKFVENAAKCASFDDVHFNEITTHAFAQAHEAVQKNTQGSACAAAICIQGSRLLVGNVGDCRIYKISGSRLEQISEDQVDNAGDPTQVVGGKRIPQAYAESGIRVREGDVIILCSDGVWKHIDPADILQSASGGTAREIAARLQRALAVKRRPDSDDATALVAVIKRVGRPFWETDSIPSTSGEYNLKDDLDMKLNEVLAELLNRVRAPLEKQNAVAEKALNQLGTAVDELRHEIDVLRSEIGGARRGRKQGESRSAYMDVGISVVILLAGMMFGWLIWGTPKAVQPQQVSLQLPEKASIVSQKYENDRILVRFIDGDKKPRLAIFRLEDGGVPFAIIDLPAESKPNGSVP